MSGPQVQAPGRAEEAPAAVSQEAMVWHEQFAPGSFNLPCLVRRHRGRLEVGALERGLTELVRRHQPLRSTFSIAGGRLRQVVAAAGPVALATVDVSGLSAPDRDAEVDRLLADASRRPFDLAAGPLFEPLLVRLADEDHLLVVRLHHTVFDDWSVDVFRRELSALYAAGLAGTPSPLPEPTVSFVDVCRRAAAGPGADEERSWWRRELDGAPMAVQLALGTGEGPPVRVDLPPDLATALRAAAPALRATPFMTALAAFSLLVSRATGRDDLLLATVVAHRNDTDLVPLIGCFTKKVPLRLRLDGGPTFAELVGRARASLLGSLAHQDLAFDAAVHEGLGRLAAEHGVVPQVSVVFQGETPQQATMTLPGLVSTAYDAGGSAFREERHFSAAAAGPVWGGGIYGGTFLIVSLLDGPERMAFVARGVFDRAAGRIFLQDLCSLLAEMLADPGRPLVPVGGGRNDDPDVVDLRGFHVARSPLEAAMRTCAGVADVGVAVVAGRLVAFVVADPVPTRAHLREALWRALPGAPWPAEGVLVDAVVRRPDGCPDVDAMAQGRRLEDGVAGGNLAGLWAEASGRAVGPQDSFWQDFSFLPVLDALDLPNELVVRCRTPEMLETAMAVAPRRG